MKGIASPNILEIEHANLLDYGEIESRLAGFDACFFCLGISWAGMSTSLPLAMMEALLNPDKRVLAIRGDGAGDGGFMRRIWKPRSG